MVGFFLRRIFFVLFYLFGLLRVKIGWGRRLRPRYWFF